MGLGPGTGAEAAQGGVWVLCSLLTGAGLVEKALRAGLAWEWGMDEQILTLSGKEETRAQGGPSGEAKDQDIQGGNRAPDLPTPPHSGISCVLPLLESLGYLKKSPLPSRNFQKGMLHQGVSQTWKQAGSSKGKIL